MRPRRLEDRWEPGDSEASPAQKRYGTVSAMFALNNSIHHRILST